MNTGLGFSEILLVAILVLLFFGSKEIPQFIRTVAKFMARIRFYTDKVKREFDSVTQITSIPQGNSVVPDKKALLRKEYIAKRKDLSESIRDEKSNQITSLLCDTEYLQNASVVMLYASMGSEVKTDNLIKKLLASGKRIVLPYCKDSSGEMAIAEIFNPETDVAVMNAGFPEVIESLRKPFFKSDLGCVICPGVAFDRYGARLGRGKSFYDRFLKELKGSVPILGIGYSCQIYNDSIPFEYHDIPMDQIYTENGPVMAIPQNVQQTA
jgi:5-formyltetrahydrofolate cyclo-ligase